MALKRKFNATFRKIKLILYRSLFKKIKNNGDALSSTELLCLECIYLMDKPTVSQFADFLEISPPNAAYKIKILIKKGFLTKERSKQDGREYRLVPTQKFFDHYENKDSDESTITSMKTELDKDETKKMEKILNIISDKA